MHIVQPLPGFLTLLSYDSQHDILQRPSVVLHQPLVLEHDIDLLLRMHEEVVGSCSSNATLPLTRRNVPDLHLLVLSV